MARHPDMQEKAWKEIDDLMGARMDIKWYDNCILPTMSSFCKVMV